MLMSSRLLVVAVLITVLLLSLAVSCACGSTETHEFDFLTNSYNHDDTIEAAKLALGERYGENWYRKYQIDGSSKHPAISFEHIFIRINPPDFCLLVTGQKIFFLSPEDFNKFLEINGSDIELEEERSIIDLFEIYLKLYGLYSYGVQDEEIFTEKHLKLWTDEARRQYKIDPEEFTHIDIESRDSDFLLVGYTITRESSYPRIPSPQDIIISHYSVKIGSKGEIYLDLIDRTRYEEIIPAGPR